jgi:hypothetical protein
LYSAGRYADSLPHSRESWERSQRMLGEESAQTLLRGNSYAVVLEATGKKREAIEVLEAILPAQFRRMGPTHKDLLLTQTNLSVLQLDVGEVECAEGTVRDLLARAESDPSVSLHTRAAAHWSLGRVQRTIGCNDESRATFAIASRLYERSTEAGSRAAIVALLEEAYVLDVMKQSAEARAVLERAALCACRRGTAPDIAARAFATYADSLRRGGETERAKDVAEIALTNPSLLPPVLRKLAQKAIDAQ